VGQEHITKTLEQALKQGKISHAYLFTGPRGVGKTSVARILAHEVNGLPYDDDSQHLDIIEIDAASNRRIDEIRELRDKVHVAPTQAKYKVYIIDEVHMLTREAFNALLKTLEEPPAHVIFILATTDAHKLPDTIVSRTQRFSFKPVERPAVAAQLRAIAKQEKLKVSDEALELLAAHGEGSFRDSISLLDQAASNDEITLPVVQQLLGVPSDQSVQALLSAAQGSDSAGLMSNLTALYDQGYQAPAIAKRLGALVRTKLVAGQMDSTAALSLLSRLLEVPASHDPERFLEIVLLEQQPKQLAQPRVPEAPQPQPAEAKPATPAPAPKLKPKPTQHAKLESAIWPEVLRTLKQRHNTLYGVVRMAEPDFSEAGKLRLGFAFAFHQKRLNEAANREKLAVIIQELTGQPVEIEGFHDKDATPAQPQIEPEPLANDSLETVSSIFGSAELLES